MRKRKNFFKHANKLERFKDKESRIKVGSTYSWYIFIYVACVLPWCVGGVYMAILDLLPGNRDLEHRDDLELMMFYVMVTWLHPFAYSLQRLFKRNFLSMFVKRVAGKSDEEEDEEEETMVQITRRITVTPKRDNITPIVHRDSTASDAPIIQRDSTSSDAPIIRYDDAHHGSVNSKEDMQRNSKNDMSTVDV
jgi:hypothetical protein